MTDIQLTNPRLANLHLHFVLMANVCERISSIIEQLSCMLHVNTIVNDISVESNAYAYVHVMSPQEGPDVSLVYNFCPKCQHLPDYLPPHRESLD